MHVFARDRPAKPAAANFLLDLVEPGQYRFQVFAGEYADLRQHIGMRARTRDILFVHALIELYRSGEGLDKSVSLFSKASAPGLVFLGLFRAHAGSGFRCFFVFVCRLAHIILFASA